MNLNMNIGGPKQDPEVILTFDGDKVIKETKGFEGADCIKQTAFIMEALGATDNKRTLKAEYTKTAKKVKTERIRLS
jgi:hypothetical protein